MLLVALAGVDTALVLAGVDTVVVAVVVAVVVVDASYHQKALQ